MNMPVGATVEKDKNMPNILIADDEKEIVKLPEILILSEIYKFPPLSP